MKTLGSSSSSPRFLNILGFLVILRETVAIGDCNCFFFATGVNFLTHLVYIGTITGRPFSLQINLQL